MKVQREALALVQRDFEAEHGVALGHNCVSGPSPAARTLWAHSIVSALLKHGQCAVRLLDDHASCVYQRRVRALDDWTSVSGQRMRATYP